MKLKLPPVFFGSVWLYLALAASTTIVAGAADTAPGPATPAAKLEIQRAVYGAAGFGLADVKTNLMALIQSGQNSIVANNDLVGYDPAPEQTKQLHIEYTLDGKPGTVTVDEGKTFTYSANASPPFAISLPVMKPPNIIVDGAADTASGPATSAAKLEIQRAVYGAAGFGLADVKTNLMALIQSGQNSIVANNDLVGYDPAPEQTKQLHIEYTLDGKPGTVTVDEGKTFTYSANASPPFAISLPVMKPPNIIVDGAADTASGPATSAAKLEIQRAVYGAAGFGLADVKTNLMALIQSGQNSIVANNDLVGYDPAPEQTKQLHIEYTLDGKPGTVTVDEGKTFTYSANASPPFAISLPVMKPPNIIVDGAADTASGPATSAAKLEIQRAVYGADGGSVDVKANLMALIQSGQKSIAVNNDLVGYDPASGQGKQLHIEYTLDGKPGTVTVDEGKTLTYSADASPPFVTRSAKNPLNSIVAENYDAVAGEIKNEVCSEGGYDLCSIHDGNYVVYKDYDFDSGVAAFKARVASTNRGLIEVRLDGPAGPLIGRCPFDGTGGWQDWRDATCNIDNSQAGIRNVCLVFRGDTQSALVNLSWFVFLKSAVVDASQISLGDSTRVDVGDNGPQATNSWGVPKNQH